MTVVFVSILHNLFQLFHIRVNKFSTLSFAQMNVS